MCEPAGGEAGPSWPWPHSLAPAFLSLAFCPVKAAWGNWCWKGPLVSKQHTRQGFQHQPRSQFRSATLAA